MSFRIPESRRKPRTTVKPTYVKPSHVKPPPEPPTPGDLANAQFDESTSGFIVRCHICGEEHSTREACSSRIKYSMKVYYPEPCICCYGHHAKGKCHYEYLRDYLQTPTYCARCETRHSGYCIDPVLCERCNRFHNLDTECQVANLDGSNNFCPRCGLAHSLHCPSEVELKIKSTEWLWCNNCKCEHEFHQHTPFCYKCQQRHRLVVCPPSWTYCRLCKFSHSGGSCKEEATTEVPESRSNLQLIGRSAEYP